MIVPQLHRQPVAVDTQKHRTTRLRLPVTDWSHLAASNALFLTAPECVHAACDYPVVFVKAGVDEKGEVDYAPIAVFGLSAGENLFLDGGRWRGHHLPALMGTYPFCVARAGTDRYAVCVDEASAALANDGDGERLFDEAGQATEFSRKVQSELERLEGQIASTRNIARRIAALGLLSERRFDATLPDGRKLAVDGFFTVEEEKLRALPEATVLELHRDGLLTFIHAHWVSLGQMRKLLEWRIARESAAKG
jgi:SapC